MEESVSMSIHQDTATNTKMFVAGAVGMIPPFATGCCLVFAVVALPFYKDPNNTPLDLHLDVDQASWYMSVLLVASLVGTLLSGIISDWIGRKKTLMLSNWLMAIGWIGTYFASNFPTLVGSRMLMGVSCGCNLSTNLSLLSEISIIRYRGSLGTLNTMFTNLGMMFVFVYNYSVPREYLLPLCALPSMIFLVASFFLAESPMWLVRQKKYSEAEATLYYLRGKDYNIAVEVKELSSVCHQSDQESLRDQIAYLKSPAVIKPTLLMGLLMILQPLSVILATFGYGCGVGPVLYALLGEIFPPRAKGIASSLALACRDLSGFALLKFVPTIIEAVGKPLLFVGHGLIAIIACGVVLVFLPETKGLSLTELMRIFEKEKQIFAELESGNTSFSDCHYNSPDVSTRRNHGMV
eukprot:maker-scaffold278_size225338-snap-gene-0.15 protein:Tk03815 transcript:maker-scaffold278_size225338-snap-gene-0.15-mRNA-1 annotation:"solute carrier family facilitated glucose transporter member 8 isoform x2"